MAITWDPLVGFRCSWSGVIRSHMHAGLAAYRAYVTVGLEVAYTLPDPEYKFIPPELPGVTYYEAAECASPIEVSFDADASGFLLTWARYKLDCMDGRKEEVVRVRCLTSRSTHPLSCTDNTPRPTTRVFSPGVANALRMAPGPRPPTAKPKHTHQPRGL
jgi:hypothetical protein